MSGPSGPAVRPPPPSRGFTALVVAAVVVAVSILLVFAFVIGPLTSGPAPTVKLAAGAPSPTGVATVSVADASRFVGPSYYRVNVSNDVASGSSLPMPTLDGGMANVTAGSRIYRITWHDADQSHSLSVGDSFEVRPLSVTAQDWGTHIHFWLLTSANATVDSVRWVIPGIKPVVTFSPASVGDNYAVFQVASVSSSTPVSLLRFNLRVDGVAAVSDVVLAFGSNSITVSSLGYWVNISDISGTGMFTGGDFFLIQPKSGMFGVGANYTFLLNWGPDGSTLAAVGWISPVLSKPVVTFSTTAVTLTYASFTVVGASSIVPTTDYMFQLSVNGVYAPFPVTLYVGTNTISVNGTTFWVNYTDVSGNGNLKAGDLIQVQPQPAGTALAAGAYTFTLLWGADGSTIQTESWSV